MATEDKIKEVKLEATRLLSRKDWQGEAIHWQVQLTAVNGYKVLVEYSEGIGHFIKQGKRTTDMANAEASLLKQKSSVFVHAWGLMEYCKRERVEIKNGQLTPKPPALKDVLYSLTRDSDAINYSFNDWCANYGYDTDSRKALDTWQACTDSYRKLRALGFTLEELQEYFQDY